MTAEGSELVAVGPDPNPQLSPLNPELVIFIGLPAAGKTTFFRERFAATHTHVSKDNFPNARNRNRRQGRLIEGALKAGRSVVVDNTNPTPEERLPLIETARAHGARAVGYFFGTTVADARERNERRQGRAQVPVVALYTIAKRFVPPTPEEGYDELRWVRIVEGGFEVQRWEARVEPE